MRMGSLTYSKCIALLLIICSSAGCGKQVLTSEEFADYAKTHKVGAGNDYMLEISHADGEWEPVMFVFGYYESNGARIECQIAADALKKVNYNREYRCVLANVS